ncbi:MAG: hypothetical protein QF689_13225 [Candidatus Latescibacteria bacterium]|jgi:hypothetical protein|nr:hypothetical protein [Gemmatimonadaceae bacterium]MDP6014542.1 hypothetical protein [Candidatus Latescibacterota bacterium]MDP7449547.1 hypothetical protein [Candidatus Latescibacterota bacterium]HJP31471.1 hypothetical protein [Candidatus Latescibacterota bacterium]
MAELVSLQRLVADGYHNAFTDLTRWRDHTYLVYRQAQGHGIEPPGDVVVLRSADLVSWEQVARFDTGGDDRDAKLLPTADRLAVSFGTWVPRWRTAASCTTVEHDLITHVSVSRDGTCWSTPTQIYGINYWLWRLLAADGAYWCAAYHFGRRDDRDMRTVHLLRSDDLFDWRLVTQMRSGGGPGEPVLYSPEPGLLHTIVRTLEPDHHSWLGVSREPYDRWEWHDLGVMIHAPVVLQLPDGRWIVAGRSQETDLPADTFVSVGEQHDPAGHHTSVWEIEPTRVRHLLTVPSGRDCSYCGLALASDGESVLMSYYSQHERLPLPADPPTPSDVYLAWMAL